MIIAKGKICTHQVRDCRYNPSTHLYDLTYMSGARYSYAWNNVTFLRNPNIIPITNSIVETEDGKRFSDVSRIYEFSDKGLVYYHFFSAGKGYYYRKAQVKIRPKSESVQRISDDVFNYLKEISDLSEIPNDNGEIILRKYYENMQGVSRSTALYTYLNPSVMGKPDEGIVPIFPFGCNESQYDAVSKALNNQISVIQGPPGTGKTQTILNIIANLIINNKSVIVVSNNNSATQNVLEKLSGNDYHMDFMVASLGNKENKTAFVNSQTGKYPDLTGWEIGEHPGIMKELMELSNKLHRIYKIREDLADYNEKKHEIELEYKYFMEYIQESCPDALNCKCKPLTSAETIMKSVNELGRIIDKSGTPGKWYIFKNRFLYRIGDKLFFKNDISSIQAGLQHLYYRKSLDELDAAIEELDNELADYPKDIEKQAEQEALSLFKAKIKKRYSRKNEREIFSEKTLFTKPERVQFEYPVVLSTTFSARACVDSGKSLFDYVIMDEASQVDVATGALALSVAKNAVIVGDLKQLPNVVTEDTKKRAEEIRSKYKIREAYDFTKNSFLSSVVAAIPDVSSTLLREHYRCHPRIISFCNQKFYNGELLIMTPDDGDENVLKAYKTVEGNHSRDHYNQRQIDVIKEEILPALNVPNDEIGIIAPYNAQVDQLRGQIPGIDISTVHKFQGREKDVIILSTVDDKIGDFTDDPYLLNVAVSRAKKQLIVVVSGNEQSERGNIVDLVSYIRHNNMEVIDSKVFSVFDYLYSQYREQRWKYLKDKKRVSEYDSENLMYNLLLDILKDHTEYGVQCFTPLRMIVKDHSGLSEEEIRYLSNPNTHIDFLIYNKLSKLPVVAVEVDGYSYHKEGTDQHERDMKKDHILEVVGIPIVRLNTTGSGEKKQVLSALGIE